MANERNLEAIEDGRQATVIAGAVHEYVDNRMRKLVQDVITMYRGGQVGPISHDMLIGKAAEITALADLLSDLETVGLRGDIAAKREFGDAKTS